MKFNEAINVRKREVLEAYKEAKRKYKEEPTQENWKTFCEARILCMRLGFKI